jgi:hypothetical protein
MQDLTSRGLRQFSLAVQWSVDINVFSAVFRTPLVLVLFIVGAKLDSTDTTLYSQKLAN